MEPNDIIEAILFKCVEARGYYQDIGVLADSVADRALSDSEKNDISNYDRVREAEIFSETMKHFFEKCLHNSNIRIIFALSNQ